MKLHPEPSILAPYILIPSGDPHLSMRHSAARTVEVINIHFKTFSAIEQSGPINEGMLPPRQTSPPSNPEAQRRHSPVLFLTILCSILVLFAACLLFRDRDAGVKKPMKPGTTVLNHLR